MNGSIRKLIIVAELDPTLTAERDRINTKLERLQGENKKLQEAASKDGINPDRKLRLKLKRDRNQLEIDRLQQRLRDLSEA